MNYKKEIEKLKKDKNAVILAHYYQNGEIQDLADYVGDSYQLSVVASKTNADIIVFCGVDFMGETAKILSPEKKVLIPVMPSPCKMAMDINEKQLKEYKEKNPDRIIMAYVNTTSKVKALADVCVTSSNAEKIIEAYKDKKIMYCPDKNLATYVKEKTNYDIDAWNGCCDIHDNLSIEDVKKQKELHPKALLLVHPEARTEVLKEADFIGSTKGIVEFAKTSNKTEFIIGTECGILHRLRKENPDKKFYLLSDKLLCNSMKLITPKDLYDCLNEEKFEVKIDEETLIKAKKALTKMMELS